MGSLSAHARVGRINGLGPAAYQVDVFGIGRIVTQVEVRAAVSTETMVNLPGAVFAIGLDGQDDEHVIMMPVQKILDDSVNVKLASIGSEQLTKQVLTERGLAGKSGRDIY